MNLATYERDSVAAWYGELQEFFAAERTIWEIVTARYPKPDMVDIGIGGGRTTKIMAHLCNSYVGLDYAASMVEAARATTLGDHRLMQADARDMGAVADAGADFVLFSFNGIDYVPHEDRLRILREVRRVCRPGAYFAFSTHNLLATSQEFAWKGPLLKGTAKYFLKQCLNFPLPLRCSGNYALLNDGAHQFGLRTYYVRPDEQVRQLEEAGFSDIRFFGFSSGREMDLAGAEEPFPYYLCEAS